VGRGKSADSTVEVEKVSADSNAPPVESRSASLPRAATDCPTRWTRFLLSDWIGVLRGNSGKPLISKYERFLPARRGGPACFAARAAAAVLALPALPAAQP
jgi:hypothetical protein